MHALVNEKSASVGKVSKGSVSKYGVSRWVDQVHALVDGLRASVSG